MSSAVVRMKSSVNESRKRIIREVSNERFWYILTSFKKPPKSRTYPAADCAINRDTSTIVVITNTITKKVLNERSSFAILCSSFGL